MVWGLHEIINAKCSAVYCLLAIISVPHGYRRFTQNAACLARHWHARTSILFLRQSFVLHSCLLNMWTPDCKQICWPCFLPLFLLLLSSLLGAWIFSPLSFPLINSYLSIYHFLQKSHSNTSLLPLSPSLLDWMYLLCYSTLSMFLLCS